jgi:hypothetical protein
MRNIDASQWMKNPSLEVIQSGQGAFGSRFTLDAQQTSPDSGGNADGAGRRIVASAGEP